MGPVARICGPLGIVTMLSLAVRAQAPAVVLNPSLANPWNRPFAPLVAANGDTVHAVGLTVDPQLPITDGWVRYARSTDGGRTWPVLEVDLAANACCVSDIAVAGDTVIVLFRSRTTGPATVTSTDAGQTFGAPVPISQHFVPPLPGASWVADAALCHGGGTTTAIWSEQRPTGGWLWANHSVDGGRNWQPIDTRLDQGMPIGHSATVARRLRVIQTGSTIDVLWLHDAGAAIGTVLHQRSLNGRVWLAAPRAITTHELLAAGGNGNVLLCSKSSTLPHWYWSTDGGSSWNPRTDGPVGMATSIVVRGQDVLTARLGGAFPNWRLEIGVSRDGGATWLPTYLVPVGRRFVATAHMTAGAWFIHFEFLDQIAPIDGAVIQSDDRGTNWRLLSNHAEYGVWPFDDTVFATGYDRGNSAATRIQVLAGHTMLDAGPGASAMRLAGDGLPTLGRTFELSVTGVPVGAPVGLATSLAPLAPFPLFGATIWLGPPMFFGVVRFATMGEARLPVSIPADAGLAGLRLASQAIALDPGSLGNSTVSNALETWIR